MNKELAKTLTTALVQFIDRERPEGTMDCSSYECEKIEKAFEGGLFDVVEKTIKKKLSGLTQFEEKLVSFALQCGGQWDTASVEAKKWSREFLALAKKEIFKNGEGTYFYSKDGDVTYMNSMPVYAPTIPIMPTTPSGWGCDGTHCTNPHGDCIICPRRFSYGGTITSPNTASGTSTATLDCNTSATDSNEHNPSFTD